MALMGLAFPQLYHTFVTYWSQIKCFESVMKLRGRPCAKYFVSYISIQSLRTFQARTVNEIKIVQNQLKDT